MMIVGALYRYNRGKWRTDRTITHTYTRIHKYARAKSEREIRGTAVLGVL